MINDEGNKENKLQDSLSENINSEFVYQAITGFLSINAV